MNRFLICTVLIACAVGAVHALELQHAGNLPYEIKEHSAIYDNEGSIIVIGGFDSYGHSKKNIFKYSVSTEEVQQVGRFSSALFDGTASSDGHFGYFFGGFTTNYDEGWGPRSGIWKFDLADPDYPSLIGDLPTTLYGHASSSDGQGNIYIAGGQVDDIKVSSDILKYNTAANSIEVVGKLPRGVFETSSTWTNGAFYVIGGEDRHHSDNQSYIYKFDPTLDTVETVGVIPFKIWAGAAVTVGTDIYVVGGVGGARQLNLFKFDTVTAVLEQIEVTNNVPAWVCESASVYVEDQNRIYILGTSNQYAAEDNIKIYYLQL